ncbi:MAG: Hsp70 family protein, partial [Burkholderiales bacterium]|nr:Hsp70 family protein [Burkholderiales bacterium]
GVEASIMVKPSYGLADDEISRMLTDSMQYASADVQARKLAEALVDATAIVNATTAALEQDGDLLRSNERAVIEASLQQLSSSMQTNDANAIYAATEKLNEATGDFAAKRMDAAVKRGLAGQNIAEM